MDHKSERIVARDQYDALSRKAASVRQKRANFQCAFIPARGSPSPGFLSGRVMASERPLIIVTRKLPDVVETRLRELFDARLNLDDKPFTREELIDAAKSPHVLGPTVTDRIDRGVMGQARPPPT